jgi:hypothetical protein
MKMPIYTFKRTTDGAVLTKRMSFSDYEAIRAGTKQVTDENGLDLEIVFNPGTVGFVMKDGVTGGWASKTEKERKYRVVRNSQMARREKDHVFKSRLVPNYQGEEAHSWSDVRDHVRTTKGAESASTYDSLVTKEKAT